MNTISLLTVKTLVRKISAGEIPPPPIRMEKSQKCAKSIHIQDLANYIDERRAAAVKECAQLRAQPLIAYVDQLTRLKPIASVLAMASIALTHPQI